MTLFMKVLEPLQLIKSRKFNAYEVREIRKLVENNTELLNKNGMSTLIINKSFLATDLLFTEDKMTVFFEDGRELAIPLEWFSKLRNATREQLKNWRFIGNGEGIHWEELDEDILIENLLE